MSLRNRIMNRFKNRSINNPHDNALQNFGSQPNPDNTHLYNAPYNFAGLKYLSQADNGIFALEICLYRVEWALCTIQLNDQKFSDSALPDQQCNEYPWPYIEQIMVCIQSSRNCIELVWQRGKVAEQSNRNTTRGRRARRDHRK